MCYTSDVIKGCFKILMLSWLTLALSHVALAQYEDEEPVKLPSFEEEKVKRPKANVIKIAPIALLFGQILAAAEARVIYELVVAPQQSYYVGVSLNFQNFLTLALWDSTNQTNGSNWDPRLGGRVQGGYKFYPIKALKAPNGLFVGPHVSYNFLNVEERSVPDARARIVYLNASALAGYQLVLGDRFVMELVTGFGYRRNYAVYYTRNQKTYTDIWNNGLKVTITYNIGVYF